MQVLIINCFSDSPRGVIAFNNFQRLIERATASTFSKYGVSGVPTFTIKRLNELGEYAFDWQHDALDESRKQQARMFDKLELIFVGGDMSILPWDPIATQLVTLLNMTNIVKKPVFLLGLGAYVNIYATATQGTRFNVLNGPHGSGIDELAMFGQYGPSSIKESYPSGFLDSDTGDMYTYNPQTGSWNPVCNIGMFRMACQGVPSSTKVREPIKKYSRSDHTLSYDQDPEAIDDKDQIILVRNEGIQHYLVKDVTSIAIVAKLLPEWILHSDRALPTNCGIRVVASIANGGSVIMEQENKVVLAVDFTDTKTAAFVETLMVKYMNHIIAKMRNSKERLDASLFEFIFGKTGFEGGGGSNILLHKKSMAQALATRPIRSSKIGGPIMIQPPAFDKLFRHISTEIDYQALTRHRMNSTMGRETKTAIRVPSQSRHKRMDAVMQESGLGNDSVLKKFSREIFSLPSRTIVQGQDDTAEDDAAQNHYNHDIMPSLPSGMNYSFESSTIEANGKHSSLFPSTIQGNGKNPTTGIARKASATCESDDPKAKSETKTKTRDVRFVASSGPSRQLATCPTISPLISNQNEPRRPLSASSTRNVSSRVLKQVISNHLPHAHPNIIISNEQLREDGNNVIQQPEVIHLRTSHMKPRPYSSYRRFQVMAAEIDEQDDASYKGMYTCVYESPLEKEIHDYNKAKKTFVSEKPFRRHFGVASAMPLRQEGLIRGQGLFPEQPDFFVGVEELKAGDWLGVRKEDKSKRVAGDWKFA